MQLLLWPDVDIGSYQSLNQYQKARVNDQAQTINATSSLVSLFSNNHWPLVAGRNMALAVTDCIAPLKKPVAEQMLGWRHQLSPLTKHQVQV